MDVVAFVLFILVVYTIAAVIGFGVIEIIKRMYRFFTRLIKNGNKDSL